MSSSTPGNTSQTAKKAAENFVSSINNIIQKNNDWWNEAKKWLEHKYGDAIEQALDFGNSLIKTGDDNVVPDFERALNTVVGVTDNAESNIRMVRIIDIARNNNDEIRIAAKSALADLEHNNDENYNNPPFESSYSDDKAPNKRPQLFVYNITITKKVVVVIISVLNELKQKYSTWYTVVESDTEVQFGKNIARLLQISIEITDVHEGTPYALITSLMSALTETDVSIIALDATFKDQRDKNILAEFAGVIHWAKDILENLDGVDENIEIVYTGSTVINNPEDNAGTTMPGPDKKTIDIKTLKGRLMGDQSTGNDLLGFSVYATAIAQLIRKNVEELKPEANEGVAADNEDQKAGKPFNIGIIAPWGHGKTTLMKNVQNELDKDYSAHEEIESKLKANDDNINYKATTYEQLKNYLKGINLKNKEDISGPFPSVWFNAWRYQSSEQIWAGLGHAIITQLSSRLPAIEQEKFWFKLQLSRVDILKMRKEFYADIIKKMLPWLIMSIVAFAAAIIFFTLEITSSISWRTWPVPSLIAIMGVLAPAIGYFKSIRDKVTGKVSVYFDEPDYSEKLGVYHHIIEDLHKVFSLVLRDDQRAVIFIDDLDRCSPNIIAEVFEAVNLMMIDPVIGKYCYFIFGMDAQVIAAALDNKYTLMSGKLKEQEEVFGSVGWYFLDKFIQLPFNVPIMSGDERLNFLRFYFELEKPPNLPKAGNKTAGKQDSVAEIKAAMKEENANTKQQRLAEVFSNIDDKNIKEKNEAIKEAVKEKLKEDDSEQIIDQLKFISPFLSSSPREIIRYINLLRFFNATLFIRQSMIPGSVQADFKGVAKYLLIALKWPQLVRWIQWEGDDELVLYNTTKEKARFLDELVNNFIHNQKEEVKKYTDIKKIIPVEDAAVQQSTEDLYSIWNDHCNTKLKNDKTANGVRKLAWLYDRQIMEVLLHDETLDSSFEKALLSKMW